jgi:hypothetical protein
MKLYGGKKGTRGKTARKHKKTANKKGGKSCKGKRGRLTGRKTTRKQKQKGGMFGTMTAVAKTALVPFGLFAAQKMVQRRRRTSRK